MWNRSRTNATGCEDVNVGKHETSTTLREMMRREEMTRRTLISDKHDEDKEEEEKEERWG